MKPFSWFMKSKKNKVGYINLFHGIFEFISSKFPVE